MVEKIDIWELWEKEFKNAKSFFDSKGNIQTKSRLKDKWYNEFKEILFLIAKEVSKSNN